MARTKAATAKRKKPTLRESACLAAHARRQLATLYLHDFVLQGWHVIEPDVQFVDNWHIRALCEHLEAVTDGRINNLLVNVPPGTMKSHLFCAFWPAWVWIRQPQKRFMFSSYAESLSLRDSVRCRDVILSEWYQDRWPMQLREDQNTKGKFENSAGGWRMVASIGGKGTGEHPDFNCLHPDAKVLTSTHGKIPVSEIVERKISTEVWSWNHHSKSGEWSSVKTFTKRKGKHCVEIVADYHRLKCTADHPVFVIGKGYIAASEVQPGDKIASHSLLLGMWDNIQPSSEARSEIEKTLLLAPLSRNSDPWRSSSEHERFRAQTVCELRQNNGSSETRSMDKVLLLQVPSRVRRKEQTKQDLFGVRGYVSAFSVPAKEAAILFCEVFLQSAQEKNLRTVQWKMGAREEQEAIQERISISGKGSAKARCCLSNVRHDEANAWQKAGRSSRRLRQGKQQNYEYDFALQILPRKTARWARIEEAMDCCVIESVKSVGTPDFVYSIGVEGNHNHFTDGILTHNCFDDPHNVQQAESDAERQAVVNWIDGTFSTRGVVRGVRRVGIMQRLHALDASGHLLSKGTWQHICLPMRYEAGRMKPTSIGWVDPRKKDGELLWPALYSESVVAGLEAEMGPYQSAAQLQQRPSPRGGGMFKREWFEIITALPQAHLFARYWDKAGTKGGTGARTAGVLMCRTTSSLWVVVDVVYGRWGASDREAVIKQTAETDRAKYGHVRTYVEREPGSGGLESAEATIRNLAGYHCEEDKVTGAKELRAEPFSSQASVGRVKLLAGKWNGHWLEETEMFPQGALKDMVDASSGAFAKLSTNFGANLVGAHIQKPPTGEDRPVAERLSRDDF